MQARSVGPRAYGPARWRHRIRMGLQRPCPLQPDLQAEVRRLAARMARAPEAVAREAINSACSADVRLGAHHGLRSDIAPCPKSANERHAAWQLRRPICMEPAS